MPRRKSFKSLSLVIVGLLIAATAALISPSSAGALQPPWVQTMVTTHQQPQMICRAYGGSISANQESDQQLDFKVTAPDGVHEGETFNIKIQPALSKYPRTDSSSGTTATVRNVYNNVSSYLMPPGVVINSVSLAPIDGNTDANADAGYYVAKENVPHGNVSGVGDVPNEDFDPLTDVPASQRISVPGIAPSAYWNTSTNRVYQALLGSGTGGSGLEYQGGSVMQAPAMTVNVTATTALAGTDLQVKLGGQLPGSEPRNYMGSQPGNFPAPDSGATLTSTPASAPWGSTTANRYVWSDGATKWPDPTFLTTVQVFAIILTVTAKAACAPGWEPTSSFPTIPSYYTGPDAIPNGTSPPISHTMVVQDVDTNPPVISVTSPIEGANYVIGQTVNADYDCNDSFGSGDDVCAGDVADGQPIDMSPGPHTFTVNAQDNAGNPAQTVVNYNVVANSDPTANHGPDQTNKKTGNTITLDGSGSTDPDGPPAQTLTYTWTQTGGHPVTLSDIHASQPTFVVPAAPDFVYPHNLSFSLTVDDGQGGTNTTVDSVNIQVTATTPTITAITKTRPPGGTTFYTGDLTTLGATVTNPDGGALAYAWSQVSGRTTTLSANNVPNPTYMMPSSGTAPTTAICTSGTGATSPTQVNCPRFQATVTATDTGGGTSAAVALAAHSTVLPTRPVANAGTAQTKASDPGLVMLNGTASTQAQGHAISYAWSQTGGPAVTLSATNVASPTFTPAASGGSPVVYTFSLTVVDTQSPITGTGTNGNTSTAATTTVTLVPNAVVANAGPNQTGKVAGNLITLDASASTDPNLAPLSYTWTQVANGAPTLTLSDANIVNPTFTAPPATTNAGYTAQFNVTATNGGPNAGDTDTSDTPVSISVGSSTPTATANRTPSGTVYTGDLITLGATIVNPDGTNPADYTYLWTQTNGRTTTLSSNTAANPTYTLPTSGSSATAACTSGSGSVSATSANCPRWSVVVTKINTGKASAANTLAAYGSTLPGRPTANAGTDQNVKVGSGTVTFSGSGTQAQGRALTYAWTAVTGGAPALTDPDTANPTFTAPNTPGAYTYQLITTDPLNPITTGSNQKTSTADTVVITISNYASPVVSAGSNASYSVGTDGIQLSGSASQADNHNLTYLWTQTAGTSVTLSDNTILNPTFDAPNVGTTLKFTLTVTDTENPNPAAATTVSSELTIGIGEFAGPIANPGPGQTVHRRDVVSLDASGSSQADGHDLDYLWEQTSGTPVTLSDATAAQPTFTAPEAPGSLKFRVTVTDTQNPNPAVGVVVSSEVQIDVQDYAAPTANAGPNQTNVDIDDVVTLDGSLSAQDDGHELTYLWTQVDNGAPTVTLDDPTAEMPTFIAPIGPATLEFELVVDDTFNSSSPDTVLIDVNGIAGLDFSANLNGVMQWHKAATPYSINVVNNGSLARTITAATLSVSIKRNNVAVPSSEYVLQSKSVALAAHKTTTYSLKWNHGTAQLHAGDVIQVKTCVNVLGDSNPSNNCNTKVEPLAVRAFAWPANTLAISARSTASQFKIWLTNTSSYAIGPIRAAENVAATVRVNGGAPQATVASARAPFTLGAPYARTEGMVFTWQHLPITKGDSVEVTACAVIPGNQLNPACFSRTVIATK